MATWRELIAREMLLHGETWESVESVEALETDSLDRAFDDDFGALEGHPFCVLRPTHWVYFPG